MKQITAEKALELWMNYKNDFFKSMEVFAKPPSSIYSFNQIKRAKTQGCMAGIVSVSYTHLTLPTILRV